MLMVGHHLETSIPEDVASAEPNPRRDFAGEDVLCEIRYWRNIFRSLVPTPKQRAVFGEAVAAHGALLLRWGHA